MHDVTVFLLVFFCSFTRTDYNYRGRIRVVGMHGFAGPYRWYTENEQLECDGRRAGNNRSPSSSACIPVLLTRIVGIHTLCALSSFLQLIYVSKFQIQSFAPNQSAGLPILGCTSIRFELKLVV